MSYENIIRNFLENKSKEFRKEWLLNMRRICDNWAKNQMLVDSNDREIKEVVENLLKEHKGE